jgi:VanZ family protein
VIPPAPEVRRAWLTFGYALIALVIYLSLTPRPPESGFEHADKLHHLLAYGVLMGWFAQLFAGASRRAWAVAFVALGLGLEVAQGMTGYRMFSWLDFAADSLGVLIGWGLAPPRVPDVPAWISARRR